MAQDKLKKTTEWIKKYDDRVFQKWQTVSWNLFATFLDSVFFWREDGTFAEWWNIIRQGILGKTS